MRYWDGVGCGWRPNGDYDGKRIDELTFEVK